MKTQSVGKSMRLVGFLFTAGIAIVLVVLSLTKAEPTDETLEAAPGDARSGERASQPLPIENPPSGQVDPDVETRRQVASRDEEKVIAGEVPSTPPEEEYPFDRDDKLPSLPMQLRPDDLVLLKHALGKSREVNPMGLKFTEDDLRRILDLANHEIVAWQAARQRYIDKTHPFKVAPRDYSKLQGYESYQAASKDARETGMDKRLYWIVAREGGYNILAADPDANRDLYVAYKEQLDFSRVMEARVREIISRGEYR